MNVRPGQPIVVQMKFAEISREAIRARAQLATN